MSILGSVTSAAKAALGKAKASPTLVTKVIRQKSSKRLYVRGKGFTGTLKTATRFPCFDDAEEQLEDLGLLGKKGYDIVDAPEAIKLQAKAAKARKPSKGKKAFDPQNPGIIQPRDGIAYGVRFTRRNGRIRDSVRFFASEREARQHAQRMVGLHGHQRYETFPTRTQQVNSWVNWNSGMTNPRMGKARAAAEAAQSESES